MNKTLVKCAILGGIVVFVWGMVSWMVLPWHMMSMKRFDDESAVARTLQNNTSESGVYVLPNFYKGDKMSSGAHGSKGSGYEAPSTMDRMKSGKEAMRQGPFVFAMVRKEGMNPDSAAPFIAGLIVQIIAAGFITWLLMMTKAMSYMRQVTFVATIGLIAGLIAIMPHWVWCGFPFGFAAMGTIDLIIGWFLGGLVIAKLRK